MLDTLLLLLIALAVLPLLLLALYVLADRFRLKFAERILDLTLHALKLQWFGGALVNLVGGLAIAALGVWAVLSAGSPWLRLSGAMLVPVGLWRAWAGAGLLHAFMAADRDAR